MDTLLIPTPVPSPEALVRPSILDASLPEQIVAVVNGIAIRIAVIVFCYFAIKSGGSFIFKFLTDGGSGVLPLDRELRKREVELAALRPLTDEEEKKLEDTYKALLALYALLKGDIGGRSGRLGQARHGWRIHIMKWKLKDAIQTLEMKIMLAQHQNFRTTERKTSPVAPDSSAPNDEKA
ncbi:hypothetical protein FB451DRAFT_1238050 [Mycena latifolia]|nr:hypothetical protein FB451DRAFT_1238050 [Mycena latifolia]